MTAVLAQKQTTPLPPFARTPVLLLAGAVAVLLTAVSARYGYFGDELYFVAAGHHLAWGYADQPPLVPLIALLADTVAPGSVMVLRIAATLAMVVAVVLAALTAREFGGGRKAQLIAAATVVVSPNFLANGHLLATSNLDPVCWVAITFLLVRWVRTRSDRLLFVAGLVTAVALQVKFLVVGFWGVAILVILLGGPREMLRRPALWAGGAVAVLTTVPTLVWQARHGWPQLGMGAEIASESVYTGGVLGFLPLALVMGGLLVGTVLVLHGGWTLLHDPRYRYLALTTIGVTVLFLLTGGRPYYVIGMFPVLWAASAAQIERVRPAVWWRWVPTWPVYLVTIVAMLWPMSILPIAPIATKADRPVQVGNFQLDEIGWPAQVASVEAAFRSLPPDVQRGAVVVTDDYWAVSALQRFAPELRSYSPHRGAAWFATPPDDSGAVVWVGDPALVAKAFGSVRQIGKVDNGVNVNNLAQGTPIYLLQGRTQPWSQLWPTIRHL